MASPDQQSEHDSSQNLDGDTDNESKEVNQEDNNEKWDGEERRGPNRPWNNEAKSNSDEEQILSQEEKEALKGDVEELSDESGVIIYDFYSPAHINKSSLPALSVINEKIVESIQENISTLLQRDIEVTANDIEISRYGEFIYSLPQLVDMSVVNVTNIDAHALVCVDGSLIEIVMDAYFGGEGKLSDAGDKEAFTQTELNLSNKLLEIFLSSNRIAWEKSEKLDFKIVQREPQPKLINLIEDSELVVISNFKLTLDEEESFIRIAYPYKALEPIKNSLRSVVSDNSEENNLQWKNHFFNSMKAVPIELKTILVEFNLTVDEIVKLKPGDVIPFSMPDSVTVYSSTIPIFKGKVGSVSGSVAVSIDDRIKKLDS